MEKYQNRKLTPLAGLHAFTGCDTVSAFSGKGKIKALKIMPKYESVYQSLSITRTRGWRKQRNLWAIRALCMYPLRPQEDHDVNAVRELNQLPPWDCHCESMYEELITSAGYGERLWYQWLIYQILLRTDGKLEMTGHLRLTGWIVNQRLMRYFYMKM